MLKAFGQEIGIRTVIGVVLLVVVAVLSATGFVLPADQDLIVGIILGVIGGGAIASGGVAK